MSEGGLSARRGWTRWIAAAALALVAVTYIANLPLYAGASFDGWSWRMEHGRATIRRDPGIRPKPFWVDWNSEGLRWSAQWLRSGPGDWTITIPLWAPLGLCLAWCALSWRCRATGPSVAGS